MTTPQDRHRDAKSNLYRLCDQRDALLTKLVRIEGKLVEARRRLARLERAFAKVSASPDEKIQATPAPSKPAVADDPIPSFLDRRKQADAEDAAAREKIEAEKQKQVEQRREKSAVRKEFKNAKLRGELKHMPLTGRAALAHILGAD